MSGDEGKKSLIRVSWMLEVLCGGVEGVAKKKNTRTKGVKGQRG